MREAAELIGIDRSTLHRQWRAMRLPFYRPAPAMRRWCIKESAVVAYVKARESDQT
jgi:excisionase family DNA binding protein